MAWKHLYSPSKVKAFISRILGWKTVLLLPGVTAESPLPAAEKSKPVPSANMLAVASFLGPETKWQLCHFLSGGKDLKTFMKPTQRASRSFEDVPGKGTWWRRWDGRRRYCHCKTPLLFGTNGPFFQVKWVLTKDQEKQWGLLAVSGKKKKRKHPSPTC